jgi:hypothetical protein
MNLGEILDRTIQVYRARFAVFAGLAAMPALAMMGLQVANLAWWRLTPELYGKRIFLGYTPQSLVYAIAVYQASLLLQLLAWPAFSYLASRVYLGEQPTLMSALFWCFARWRGWLWLAAASWGAVLLAPEVVIAGLLIGVLYLLSEVIKVGDDAMDWLAQTVVLAGLALGWVTFLWLSAALLLAIPAWTLEGLPAGKSLRRSRKLSRGSRMRFTFARFVFAAVAWVLNVSLIWILYLLVFVVLGNQSGWGRFSRVVFYQGGGLLAAAVVSALVGPLFPIATTLFYYDQRIRHEGYDIERMMEAAGLNAPEALPGQDGEGRDGSPAIAGTGEGLA